MEGINFTLTELEVKRTRQFYEEHKDCPFRSATGGKYTFMITPTGLGDCINIRCNSCHKEQGITDIDSW